MANELRSIRTYVLLYSLFFLTRFHCKCPKWILLIRKKKVSKGYHSLCVECSRCSNSVSYIEAVNRHYFHDEADFQLIQKGSKSIIQYCWKLSFNCNTSLNCKLILVICPFGILRWIRRDDSHLTLAVNAECPGDSDELGSKCQLKELEADYGTQICLTGISANLCHAAFN